MSHSCLDAVITLEAGLMLVNDTIIAGYYCSNYSTLYDICTWTWRSETVPSLVPLCASYLMTLPL